MKFNHKRFFEGFKSEFDDSLNQAQVDGIEFLLTSFENEPLWKDVRHIAYALATIFHETAASMQPVEEGYYIGSKAAVKAFQKTLRYYPYFGRGYVQLTWNTKKIPNYQKASDALGVDFVNHPEKVLEKEYSFRILTLGMFQGWFTGKKLRDYIHGSEVDYKNARKIINGLDKANLIAGYARKFEQILKVSVMNPSVGSSPAPTAATPLSAHTLQDNSSPSDVQVVEPPPTPPQAEGQTIVDVPPVQTEPQEGYISKIRSWYAALPAFVLSVLGGFWSWLQGAATEIIVAFLASAGVVASVFIITNFAARNKDKDRDFAAKEKQKERDFELTKLQLMSAMDPNKQTVRVSPLPVVVPTVEGTEI